MPETTDLPNLEAQEGQTEPVSTDSLKLQIEALAQKLGLNLKHKTLPRALTIGMPKEIVDAKIPELFKILTSLEEEFKENAEGLATAADDVGTTVDEWRMKVSNFQYVLKMRQKKLLDAIAELKSILDMYLCMLTDELTKKETAISLPPELEGQFQEIPKPAETSAKILKQKFLAKVGISERDDLRGETPKEIAKTAVAKTVWGDFFDGTKKILEEKIPTAKKRLEVLGLLAGEDGEIAFSFVGDETKPAYITINNTVLDIVGEKTALSVLENYLKAQLIAGVGFNQAENIENFWSLISALQALRNPNGHKKTSTGIVIKRFESLPELQEKDDDSQQSKHEKRFRGNVKKRHIKEQRYCAAQQAELLNRIETVTAFLSEITQDKKIKNFGNASHICQRCDIKKTENGVFYSEEISPDQAADAKISFDRQIRENFDDRKHNRILQPQAETNLIDRANELIRTAKAAALQAIESARTAQTATENDWERSRKSAEEAWSRVIEIQRRLDKALAGIERLTGEKRQLAVQVEVQTGTSQRLEAIMRKTKERLTAALSNPGTFGNELKSVVENLLKSF